jgi:hypothetical protein
MYLTRWAMVWAEDKAGKAARMVRNFMMKTRR